MRYAHTDKNELRRGEKSLDEVPVEPRARLVTPGFRDFDNLHGVLRKDVPTLAQEGVTFIRQM